MKIIRHHDYGMALDTIPDEKGLVTDNFYFSLYELDNGNIICIHTYKSYNEKTKTYEWNEFGSVDEDGNDINETNQGSNLVIKKPWPSMLRGIWGDKKRYLETYWKKYNNNFTDNNTNYDVIDEV